ncbi:MAG: hypothetical protein AB1806_08425 [Acidobacteriota bacterium]
MSDRRPLLASVAAVCASVAAWCSLGTLTLSSAGEAGQRIGVLPALWVLVALVLIGVATAFVLRPRRGTVVPWFLSGLLILPWMPISLPPAVLAASGPVTVLVWAGILAASLAATEWPAVVARRARSWCAGPRAPLAASVLAFVIYACSSWQIGAVLPGGDEPHYLVITQSLLIDGDLRIENNHRRADYRPYFRGVLRPDYLRRGQDREIYSIHLPGVSLLVAPAFAVGGYPAARLWLAVLAAVAVGATWHMTWRVTASAGAAWFATAGAALTVPFLFLAFTVYPDGPGAVVLAAAFAMLVSLDGRPARPARWWIAAGALASTLPWLHPRFALLAASLGVVFAVRAWRGPGRLRTMAAFTWLPGASAAAWFGYYLVIYGSPDPSIVYGHYTQMAVSNAPRGLVGLLFDQQFGLVATSPVFALALAGLVPLARHHRRLAIEWLAIAAPYAVVAAMYHMWWGGQSSPARFLGPLLLLGAVPISAAWRHGTGAATRAVQAIALAVSLAMAAMFVAVGDGRFAFSFRDGSAQWAVAASTLADVPRALPSWFRIGWLEGAASAAVWVVAMGMAWMASRWLSTRLALGRGTASLVAGACIVAAAMGAASLAWRLEDATGIAPTAGQLALIRELASARVPLTVRYAPLGVGDGRELAHAMRLGNDRVAGTPPDAWLWLPDLPAGRYRLWLDEVRPGADLDVDVSIGRSRDPLLTWALRDARSGPQSFDLALPAAVHSVAVRGGPGQRAAVRSLWLQPLSLADPADPASAERAVEARRYGAAVVWALGDTVYLEADGLWVAAEEGAGLLLDSPPAGAGRRVGLRAGAVATTVLVQSGTWQASLRLKAGERRDFIVPGPAERPALVRIRTDAGFRPSQVDPASTDDRYLGVWVDLPGS